MSDTPLPTYFVFGASKGLGYQFVRELLADGQKVSALVRDRAQADSCGVPTPSAAGDGAPRVSLGLPGLRVGAPAGPTTPIYDPADGVRGSLS